MRWFVAAVAVVLLAVWLRAWTSGKDELERAVEAHSAGELEAAVNHYQYAMRWYSPGAAAPRAAADGLDEIARKAASEGKRGLALRALRRLRGGILATRHLFSPFGDRLEAVNARIAKLMAAEQMALGQSTIRGRSVEELEADHLALLQRDPTPAAGWSLLVFLSFLGWLTAVFMTLSRGLTREAKLVRPAFYRWGTTAVISFGLWLFALSQA